MIRGTAMGDGFQAWKAWTAKFAFRRAVFKGQIGDMSGRCTRAVSRAAAAELIAQEANAVRLKALLDAAREQAAIQTIEVAERRFIEAKGAWEAAQQPFLTDDATVRDDEDSGADTAAAGPVPDARPVRQVVLRSTAIAGLLLAGAVVYFDPDFSGETLLGDTRGASAAPANVYSDIDPVVSVSWPAEMATDAVGALEEAVVKTASTGETAVVRKVSALDRAPVRARRAASSRGIKPETRVPAVAPPPVRNPFYAMPEPATRTTEPVFAAEYE